jgi:hypothetical protein
VYTATERMRIEVLIETFSLGDPGGNAAFAADTQLPLGKQQVFPIESQDFSGPQALEEHHADDRQIT